MGRRLMREFSSYDGAVLSYREEGVGAPVLLIPGGPARDIEYLGDLRRLADSIGRRLIVAEMRGTGRSDVPSSAQAWGAHALAKDMECLVSNLEIEAVDVIAHSAGCNVGLLLAERSPASVARLVLVTPSARAVGIQSTDDEIEAVVHARRDEPWYDEALAASEVEEPTPEDEVRQAAFAYGSWDNAAELHARSDSRQRNLPATEAFNEHADYDPDRTRRALAQLDVPVRIIIGGVDYVATRGMAQRLSECFSDARVLVQEGAGHFPWLDDSLAFTRLIKAALADAP